MSTSPLSPEEVRAAAEVHRELGPEYDDAVVASFLEKVDRAVAARLTGPPRAQPVMPDGRRTLLKGVAIGAIVSGSVISRRDERECFRRGTWLSCCPSPMACGGSGICLERSPNPATADEPPNCTRPVTAGRASEPAAPTRPDAACVDG
jgi:hypothetical protein